MSRRIPTVALATLLFIPAVFAQDWRGQLKMIDGDLRSEQYAHARKYSIKMINSMSDHLGTGQDAMYTLALTVAYRAMAEEGLSKRDEGDWYWHVATSLYPKLQENDWKAYGKVGEWAANHSHLTPDADATAPVCIRKTEPKCPLGAIQGGYYQPVRVGAIIDGGTARCPKLVSPTQAPTLAYAAFEALHQWQFEPTAPAKYEVTVDFRPPAQ